ncbi:MAG: hypothetical protein G01um101420_305 [Parcubacteria group bacterium Gr01-1014_20]|nr:MAG: hypothetical protein G01um101420_305 [Parcubacteria group bacterium Gr01-1014_20]
MKIVYTGIHYDAYGSTRRPSFEYTNFYLTLKTLPGVEVIEYPFDVIPEIGLDKFNKRLLELVDKEKPDLLFAFMYTDELDKAVLEKIKTGGRTRTVAWFADDYWRFWNYSKNWAPYFDLVVTTYSKAVDWYRQAGYKNVLLSQWACNVKLYKPVQTEKDIEVGFVGQYKSGRGRVVEHLACHGISVKAFGFGWPGGKVSQEEMLQVFSRSKINLNINARGSLADRNVLGRILFRKSVDTIKPDFHIVDNLRAYLHYPIPHTHARPFELAGCRAFTISGYSEDIGSYYEENEEMVFYRSLGDLEEKIRYYLTHASEREKIAEAGYKRTLSEHTYEKRFQSLFKHLGLQL